MPTEGQSALSEGMAELGSVHGLEFTYATVPFTAWPVHEMDVVSGRFVSSADSLSWFETASAPVFKTGAVLTCSDGKSYSVSKLYPADPYTGKIRFAVLPGRAS